MKKITLTQGFEAIVDDADYVYLSQFKWLAKNKKYAARSPSRRCISRNFIYMHRVILGLVPSSGLFADHIDGNGLNNVRSNLRTATKSQNEYNRGKRAHNTSGFKGVCKSLNKWRAGIKFKGKYTHLGNFSSPILAAKAYDKKAKILHGEFARVNFQ